jgi:hypothetical protein
VRAGGGNSDLLSRKRPALPLALPFGFEFYLRFGALDIRGLAARRVQPSRVSDSDMLWWAGGMELGPSALAECITQSAHRRVAARSVVNRG